MVYWPLWISCLDSAIVNVWKLKCFVNRFEKKKPMSQKNFRVTITSVLLLLASDDEPAVQKVLRVWTVTTTEIKLCHKKTIHMCKMCNVHLHTKCFQCYLEENKSFLIGYILSFYVYLFRNF